MVRKPRVWYPDAIYHIMCRGNHRAEIFRDDEDREYYLTVLKQIMVSHNFELYSYCLMTNHVHLHIQTRDIDIGKIMKRINMLYAIYFNRKYSFVGQLFQGRFRSELIDTDAYQLEITRYIHLNPVKAAMVTLPEDYPWSSYRDFLGKSTKSFVNTEKILGYFSERKAERYQAYVEAELALLQPHERSAANGNSD